MHGHTAELLLTHTHFVTATLVRGVVGAPFLPRKRHIAWAMLHEHWDPDLDIFKSLNPKNLLQ